ncbi:MAG: Dabb family protein [Dehalococcoidia bacterium]|nr:Dabb family protein [Dehalococcoidia bacterium]
MRLSMFQHIVLFEVKKGTSQEDVNRMLEALRELAKFSEVAELAAGPNYSPYNQCHTHGLVVRVKDRLVLQSWESRPEVQNALRDYCMPICDSVCIADLGS